MADLTNTAILMAGDGNEILNYNSIHNLNLQL